MIKILIAVGWIFHKYKLFWREVYKFIFKFIKNLILFINGKDIEVILKLGSWQTTRSILFFFTNINLEEKPEKDFLVKKFKVKWYIWAIHYIWAFWVIFKLSIYLFVFHLYNYLKKGLWRDLWLILLEYWRWRLGIFNVSLYIIWYIYFIWCLVTNFILRIHEHRTWLIYIITKKLKLIKPIIAINIFLVKFRRTERLWSILNYYYIF